MKEGTFWRVTVMHDKAPEYPEVDFIVRARSLIQAIVYSEEVIKDGI